MGSSGFVPNSIALKTSVVTALAARAFVVQDCLRHDRACRVPRAEEKDVVMIGYS
jgi:hypothetical protein